MIDVTVVVATYGSDEWKQRGDSALLSAIKTGAKTLRYHGGETLIEARNDALKIVDTEYIVFLDGDDELDPHYFKDVEPSDDVIVTAITYTGHNPAIWKVAEHERGHKRHVGICIGHCLMDGNWVHIGAIARVEALKKVGGFKNYPVYEDYALWLSIYLAGYTFGRSERSVYYASVIKHTDHRNQSLPRLQRHMTHRKIFRDLTGKELR